MRRRVSSRQLGGRMLLGEEARVGVRRKGKSHRRRDFDEIQGEKCSPVAVAMEVRARVLKRTEARMHSGFRRRLLPI